MIEAFGGVIAARWTVQKYGMTVPFGALLGIVKLLVPVPVNGPVSNAIPLTEPALNAFWLASLVTE